MRIMEPYASEVVVPDPPERREDTAVKPSFVVADLEAARRVAAPDSLRRWCNGSSARLLAGATFTVDLPTARVRAEEFSVTTPSART